MKYTDFCFLTEFTFSLPLTALLSLLLLTGCAENPDSDIIVHKDMDKLIDEAQQTDESKAEVSDFQQYDHYTAELANEGLHVTIHADTDVDIPLAEKLSIFRVVGILQTNQ